MAWGLNGWQRLWILVGTMYTLVVAGITWASFPTLDQIAVEQRYAPDPANAGLVYGDGVGPVPSAEDRRTGRDTGSKPVSQGTIAEELKRLREQSGGMPLFGPLSSPEIGARKTFPNGNVGEWDGTGLGAGLGNRYVAGSTSAGLT